MRINWRAAAGPLALLAGLCLLPVLAGAMLRSAEPAPLDPRIGLPQPGEMAGAREARGVAGETVKRRETRKRAKASPRGGSEGRVGSRREEEEPRRAPGHPGGGRPGHPDPVPVVASPAPAAPPVPVAPVSAVPAPAPVAPAPAPVAPAPSSDPGGGGAPASYKEFGP